MAIKCLTGCNCQNCSRNWLFLTGGSQQHSHNQVVQFTSPIKVWPTAHIWPSWEFLSLALLFWQIVLLSVIGFPLVFPACSLWSLSANAYYSSGRDSKRSPACFPSDFLISIYLLSFHITMCAGCLHYRSRQQINTVCFWPPPSQPFHLQHWTLWASSGPASPGLPASLTTPPYGPSWNTKHTFTYAH